MRKITYLLFSILFAASTGCNDSDSNQPQEPSGSHPSQETQTEPQNPVTNDSEASQNPNEKEPAQTDPVTEEPTPNQPENPGDDDKKENNTDPGETTQPENPKDPNETTPTVTEDSNVVKYSAFGAIGDGKTNDMPAIIKAHQYANEHGLRVKADDGAIYYISDIEESAIIRTDTDWTGASFVIDDSNITIEKRLDDIFVVSPSKDAYSIVNCDESGICTTGVNPVARHQENLGITLPEDSVVIIFDTNIRRYIREGENANGGSPQMDVILVDKEGNIAKESPVIWDYPEITNIQVFPVDPETLTIKGGTFTTIANQAESNYNYYQRGIQIKRSNVVVDGFVHNITGEVDHGAPYNGIITMSYAANITIKNSTFTAHRTYSTTGASGLPVTMGSYDFQPTGVINLTLDHCDQTTDIMNLAYWGIMGSNFCKNITLNDCTFNRFDAHQGVVNVTITGSKLGYKGLETIGEGTLTVKDSTISSYSFITLRDDYGSSWRGDINIENSTWIPFLNILAMPLIYAKNTGTHDFGYDCYLPETVNINGLYVDDSNYKQYTYIFGNVTPDNTNDSFSYQYPLHITKQVNISNYKSASGLGWKLSQNDYMFKDVVVNSD